MLPLDYSDGCMHGRKLAVINNSTDSDTDFRKPFLLNSIIIFHQLSVHSAKVSWRFRSHLVALAVQQFSMALPSHQLHPRERFFLEAVTSWKTISRHSSHVLWVLSRHAAARPTCPICNCSLLQEKITVCIQFIVSINSSVYVFNIF